MKLANKRWELEDLWNEYQKAEDEVKVVWDKISELQDKLGELTIKSLDALHRYERRLNNIEEEDND